MQRIQQATIADLLKHLSNLMRGLAARCQDVESAAQMIATADRADELITLIGGSR